MVMFLLQIPYVHLCTYNCIVLICTVYVSIYGDYLATNTVRTPYATIIVLFWPTLRIT